jgi:putative DNA methylase
MKPKVKRKGFITEFRSVTREDIDREEIVNCFLEQNIEDWQSKGWLPDMRIEVGGPPRYQGLDLIRARGWSYWHHAFNPRQLLLAGLIRSHCEAGDYVNLAYALNYLSKLCVWDKSRDNAQNTFYNQALNTIYNYACRSSSTIVGFLTPKRELSPINSRAVVKNQNAVHGDVVADIYVTDPPYGDAVKYEEILDFFIAWLRKNPPAEFADWVWDSRRSMAIKGEDEDFRRGMVAAYKRMTECMPDNGIQVIMFTHQSGSIWADMANIVWASGLQVTAAWYVVTETESALRDGNNVKGTVLLVCRKRLGKHKTTRDELAWEIEEEVQSQVESLTGLNQQAKGLYRDENVFEDADIQMAGYAAALRVLTRYSTIDGRDMASESIRPRVKGEVTFVDDLIGYAVNTANQCLVPQGVAKLHWDKLMGAERFILKMIDMEARGFKTLDNYQNFAKAFKVRDFQAFMASRRANSARLKSAVELARSEMGEGSELHQSVLRAVLYAVMELTGDLEGDDVLAHLTMNVPNWFGDMNQREMAREFADFLAKRLEELRPEEAASARVLRDLIRNQRIG